MSKTTMAKLDATAALAAALTEAVKAAGKAGMSPEEIVAVMDQVHDIVANDEDE